MEKVDNNDMIEKYKEELLNMAGRRNNASELPNVNTESTMDLSPTISEQELNSNSSDEAVVEDQVLYNDAVDDLYDENAIEFYNDFLNRNPQKGYMKIQAFFATQALPAQGVLIEISKDIAGVKRIFYSLRTDENGIIDGIILPAPKRDASLSPSAIQPFATYNVKASHPRARAEEYLDVPVFEGVKSIQPVRLTAV